jgi:hypothetical protein
MPTLMLSSPPMDTSAMLVSSPQGTANKAMPGRYATNRLSDPVSTSSNPMARYGASSAPWSGAVKPTTPHMIPIVKTTRLHWTSHPRSVSSGGMARKKRRPNRYWATMHDSAAMLHQNTAGPGL